MKLLLYCTKSKWQLFRDIITGKWLINKIKNKNAVNGKIVAECDFEVEKIEDKVSYFDSWFNDGYHTQTLSNKELEERTCLTYLDLCKYLGSGKPNEKVGYAIYIKNLHIFDEPRLISDYNVIKIPNHNVNIIQNIDKAPIKMMRIYDFNAEKVIIIPICPENLCKIFNGECTIIVRKKVLKEMLK